MIRLTSEKILFYHPTNNNVHQVDISNAVRFTALSASNLNSTIDKRKKKIILQRK